MSRQSETGESSASILHRANLAAWRRMKPLLDDGAHITRPPRLSSWFATNKEGQPSVGGLTPAFVKKLERHGIIQHVGVDRYALTEKGRTTELPSAITKTTFEGPAPS